MTIDRIKPINPALVGPRSNLPPDEQAANDQAIIFVLASLMVDTYVAITTRNNITVTQKIMAVSELFKSDPTFLARFKKMQVEAVRETMTAETQPPEHTL